MKFRDRGFEPGEVPAELHQQAFQTVDCTRCANRCNTMDIKFSDEDIERISGHLNMTTADFIEGILKRTTKTARTKPASSREVTKPTQSRLLR